MITKLTEEVVETKGKLDIVLNDKEELTNAKNQLEEENKELTSSLNDANAENERLKNVVSSYKHNRSEKNEKINKLEEENKRVFDSNRQLSTNNKMLKDDNKVLKESNKELLKELNEYKRLLEELKNNPQVVETKVEETPVIETIVENEELDSVEVHELYENVFESKDKNYYLYFRKQKAKEYSESLKNKSINKVVEETNDEEEIESLKKEFINKISNCEPLTFEEIQQNEELFDKMSDVMDNVALSLSCDAEKKKILKGEKRLKKMQKTINSQMSNKERVEEFRKKMAHKKK